MNGRWLRKLKDKFWKKSCYKGISLCKHSEVGRNAARVAGKQEPRREKRRQKHIIHNPEDCALKI